MLNMAYGKQEETGKSENNQFKKSYSWFLNMSMVKIYDYFINKN
jgi:hypothetical protein